MSFNEWPQTGLLASDFELHLGETLSALEGINVEASEDYSEETIRALQIIGGRVSKKLTSERGLVLIKGIPVEWLDNGLADRVYLEICQRVGKLDRNRAPFYDVYDRKLNGRDYVRYADTNLSHGFHTDSTSSENLPKVVGLLCVRQASQGGGTRLVNLYNVYDHLRKKDPKIVELLRTNFPRQTRSVPAGETDPSAVDSYPVIWGNASDGTLGCRYMRRWIDAGYACSDNQPSDEKIWALDCFDNALSTERTILRFRMEPTDILLINNCSILHDREQYISTDGSSRLMRRAWIY